MDKNQLKEKYGIGGGIAVMMQIQMVLIGLGLILSGYGIACSIDSPRRLIIYILQAVVCVTILFFGLFRFHTSETVFFKTVIYAYAMLEAVRCALLSTYGVSEWAGIMARLLLVALACGLVILAEHLGEKKYSNLAYLLVFLETSLFLVFALLFSTDGRLLFKVLPMVGILICASICIFNEAKIRQIKYFNEHKSNKLTSSPALQNDRYNKELSQPFHPAYPAFYNHQGSFRQ